MAEPRLTLVLGGARSGKSAFAERTAEATGLALVYVATAQPLDEAMRNRIALHRVRRAERWRTIEAPLELAEAIDGASDPGSIVLVDCLTLWVTNLMLAGRDVKTAMDHLVQAVDQWPGPVLMVSNEVGLGGIAGHPMARAFADHAGRLHQGIAARAQRVVLLVAGLPLTLKS